MGAVGDASRAAGDAARSDAADASWPGGGVVRVRGIELGTGVPEIIVPLTGDTEEAVLAQAEIARSAPARIIEWRADLLAPSVPASEHRARSLALLPRLRAGLAPGQALLLTHRTRAEGGGRAISDPDLASLLLAGVGARDAQDRALVDLVDIETARESGTVRAVIDGAHDVGVGVVGSFHDFDATPSRERIVEILRGQWALGADIAKVAVMPRSPEDVLALLAGSLAAARGGTRPHMAISMGALGAVSRVAAEVFGSCATFASAGAASAPGQLAADEVAGMLEALRP